MAGPRPRFARSIPQTNTDKTAARQTARTGTPPFDRQPVTDPDTSVRETCDLCFASFIATASNGRSAADNLARHSEVHSLPPAAKPTRRARRPIEQL